MTAPDEAPELKLFINQTQPGQVEFGLCLYLSQLADFTAMLFIHT